MYFFTYIVFLAIWQSQVFGSVILKDIDENEICESEECYDTAYHILKWMNPEVNPCDDFYDFVCGNWQKLPVFERDKYSLGARGGMVENLLPHILNPATVKGSKYLKKLRTFLIKCTDAEAINSIGVTPIQELIKKAGGWPVLDTDWSEDAWDFLEAEIALGGVLIDVSSATFWDYNTSSIKPRIRVGQSRLVTSSGPDLKSLKEGLTNKRTKAYFKKMVDVAVLLGADKSVAETAMMESLEFETVFIEELTSVPYSNKLITIRELQKAVSWLNITKLLQVYLPDSVELLPEQTIFYGEELFLALEKCVARYPSRTFANYVLSKAVYPLLDYVNVDLEMVYNQHLRFVYCAKIIAKGSLGPIMASFIANMYVNASISATELTTVIKEEVVNELEEIDWLDEVTRKEITKNITELNIEVGFPEKMLDEDELEKLYKKDELDTSSFFNFIIYDKKWTKQRDFEWLEKDYEKDRFDLGWRYWTVMGLDIYAHYLPIFNAIDVSGHFLYLLSLFSPENPEYVNYGQLGFIVAHELIHAIDMNDRAMSIEEEEPPNHPEVKRWGSNETEQLFNQKRQCFVNFYSSINDTKFSKLKLNGIKTAREDMADNGGLKLSLRAYRKFADQLGSPERKLPLLQQYSVEQLFMISAANAYCEIPTKKERIEQIATDPHSICEFRVNGVMMNSPDFSEIFNCDISDPMNPPKKCEVW